ncbi:protein FRA10AC1 homolog isoform X1 [Drosophila pseudoobscura]|uniref:Protein FRA10AC1 homolog isoform X1 n=1 Tax=Drosophila pseudoobscura pseudoobscura TaxID=46245 RepID=A0A6I8UIX6_DROPS|nr:protein FRA10AC1 homolog isoform X1 [Drosophila pseudoobscura]
MSSSQLFPISLNKLTDKERHKYILGHYVLNNTAQSESRKHKRDIDVIRENHRFLWDNDDEECGSLSWDQRLARRYYKKLFKEYCIADLTRYKENKIALRWRTEQEVVAGTGQFQCGSRHCGERTDLRSWEVNFKYIEQGVPMNALVKVRLCPTHTDQLNYRTKKKEYKKQKRREKDECRARRRNKRRKLDDTANDEGEKDNKEEPAVPEADPETWNIEAEEPTADDQIWINQLNLSEEQPSREQEFERYLEDLLM